MAKAGAEAECWGDEATHMAVRDRCCLPSLGFPRSVRELLQPAVQDFWRYSVSWAGGAWRLRSGSKQGSGFWAAPALPRLGLRRDGAEAGGAQSGPASGGGTWHTLSCSYWEAGLPSSPAVPVFLLSSHWLELAT